MAYQIRDITKKQTTKCSYNFTCLNNDTWDTCSIERDVQRAFLAVKTWSSGTGKYRIIFEKIGGEWKG